jgi:hypothetical protein
MDTTSQHLHPWTFLPPELWETNLSFASHSVYGVLLRQPKQTNEPNPQPAILFLGICPRIMKSVPTKDLYTNVHSSFTQNFEAI